MPYHIVVKNNEANVVPKFIKQFKEPKFIVKEWAESGGDHWHIWIDYPHPEAKLRRQLDKCREAKNKGVSVRNWDYNLGYFCKDVDDEFKSVICNDNVKTNSILFFPPLPLNNHQLPCTLAIPIFPTLGG